MKTQKKIMLALVVLLIAQILAARDWIWYHIKPWPRWWKLALAAAVSVFVTAAFLHAADLFDDFLFIFFDIKHGCY